MIAYFNRIKEYQVKKGKHLVHISQSHPSAVISFHVSLAYCIAIECFSVKALCPCFAQLYKT